MSIRGIARRSKTGGTIATRAHKVSCAALLATAAALAASFDESAWKSRVPVQVPERGKLAVIPLDRTFYSAMREDLADLRVVKAGEEVPYLVDTAAGAVVEKECHPGLIDKSATPAP